MGKGLRCTSVSQPMSFYECGGYRLPLEVEWEYAGTRTGFYCRLRRDHGRRVVRRLRRYSLAVAAMIVGVFSLPGACCCCSSVPLGIAAIVMGVAALGRARARSVAVHELVDAGPTFYSASFDRSLGEALPSLVHMADDDLVDLERAFAEAERTDDVSVHLALKERLVARHDPDALARHFDFVGRAKNAELRQILAKFFVWHGLAAVPFLEEALRDEAEPRDRATALQMLGAHVVRSRPCDADIRVIRSVLGDDVLTPAISDPLPSPRCSRRVLTSSLRAAYIPNICVQ